MKITKINFLQSSLLTFPFFLFGCTNNTPTQVKSKDSLVVENIEQIDQIENIEIVDLDSGKFELLEKDGWVDFEKENIGSITITKTEDITYKQLKFKVVWDDKLDYSDNTKRYYGGIKQLKIYLNNQLVNVLDSISDEIGLGEIHITFYDYNFDGFIDFTLPLDCGSSCWYDYVIYNPTLKKFEKQKSWSYLRIQKINKQTKEILAQPDLRDGRIMYKVKGQKLIKIKQEASSDLPE